MEIEVKVNATEYALVYNKKVEQVCFYLHEECVVISGIDKKDNVINNLQLEISKSDFLKISKLLSNQ
jgi:hypothetical protein